MLAPLIPFGWWFVYPMHFFWYMMNLKETLNNVLKRII